MKHIKLFESMNDEMQDATFFGNPSNIAYVYCISGDNGSAVGMLEPKEVEMLASYVENNPNTLSIQKFPDQGGDGDFVLLTGDGEWKYIKAGRTYNAGGEGSTVWPIFGFGQMLVGLAGSQANWMVGELANIIDEIR